MPKKLKGKLIVIDGVDGSGKTTQIRLLAEKLHAGKISFEIADFPRYGQKSAGLVEEYLNGKYGQVDPYKASIFYAVDRYDASFQIRQWLARGKIVISNRYVTASAGHQGGKIKNKLARGKFFRWLENLEYGLFEIPKPDLNILLNVPAKVAQKLVDKKSEAQRIYAGGKKRDLHEKDLKHLQDAERVFNEIASIFPKTKMVQCARKNQMLSPEQIHAEVWRAVSRIIGRKNL